MFKKLLNSKNVEKEPSTEELVERGFVPRDGKIDILFIFPPTTVAGRYGRKSIGKIGGNLIPLGIASLAAYVRDKGWGVGVLDCPGLGIEDETVHEIIKEKDPAIIAFSVTTYALLHALEIAKKIRNNFPKKLTVIGGSHANVAGEDTASNHEFFDVISYGLDGEYIINDIIKKFSQKNFDRVAFMNDHAMLESVKGIIYRKKNAVVKNPPREMIEDLDELPFS